MKQRREPARERLVGSFLKRGNSKCKGSEAGPCLADMLSENKEARVIDSK